MAAQVDLNLRWAHISEGRFSHVAVHMLVSHGGRLTKPISHKDPISGSSFILSLVWNETSGYISG